MFNTSAFYFRGIQMRICGEFIIKDLFDYMINNDLDILEELQNCNLYIMVDLIKMSTKCSEEEAENILYKNIEEYGLENVVEELAYEVIGHKPDNNEEVHNSEEFHTFSDVLENFYNNIQSVDDKLSISEFMGMSTRYMFRYADGLQKRFINNKNQELQSQFTNAMLIGSMLAGKLKECPQLNEDGSIHKESEIDRIKAFFAERSSR